MNMDINALLVAQAEPDSLYRICQAQPDLQPFPPGTNCGAESEEYLTRRRVCKGAGCPGSDYSMEGVFLDKTAGFWNNRSVLSAECGRTRGNRLAAGLFVIISSGIDLYIVGREQRHLGLRSFSTEGDLYEARTSRLYAR
jgi:hypothetical protein